MLERYLILSVILFCIGLYGALSRRNIIAVLICTELMLNGVNVALVAFSRYTTPAFMRLTPVDTSDAVRVLDGQAFAVFVVVVAAAEVALGLALIIALVRSRNTTDITEINLMRN